MKLEPRTPKQGSRILNLPSDDRTMSGMSYRLSGLTSHPGPWALLPPVQQSLRVLYSELTGSFHGSEILAFANEPIKSKCDKNGNGRREMSEFGFCFVLSFVFHSSGRKAYRIWKVQYLIF